MTTLCLTREELIDDLPSVFRQQNDLVEMSDTELVAAWKRFGVHAGTWDWDHVQVSR